VHDNTMMKQQAKYGEIFSKLHDFPWLPMEQCWPQAVLEHATQNTNSQSESYF
jgi:hypothetical protein